MAYTPSDGSGSTESTPKPEELATIAQAAADVASNLPLALDFDKERGLLEPATEKVANEAVDELMDELDDYLKEVKPEIVKNMKNCSKKCCGGCSKKTQEETRKKRGSCGKVASTSKAASCAASPGFQPPAALMFRAEIEAARALAMKTVAATSSSLVAANATLASVPSIVTTVEGTPAVPTITQLSAAVVELIGAITEIASTLESLIMTQTAFIKNAGIGL